MKSMLTLFFLMLAFFLSAQDTLYYESCIQAAVNNSPRLLDKQFIREQGKLLDENIRTAWYPELNLNGKVSYQSDVVELALDQPGVALSFPEIPPYQYGLNLDLRQTIYDGGYTRQKRSYESSVIDAELKKVETDLQALREKVTGIYFSILLMQENRVNYTIILENLKAREAILLAGLENGITEPSDLKSIRVEILKTLQSISELDAGKEGAMSVLEIYTGAKINHDAFFHIPYIEMPVDDSLSRPEIAWFDLQYKMLERGKELAEVKRMPRFFAFGQAGLGMPGYNILNTGTDTYYLVGAGIQWNIWDWQQTRRQKEQLTAKQQVVVNASENFKMNIDAGLSKEIAQLEHFRDAVKLDEEILKMQIDITKAAASKLENGVISATEYLQVLNEEGLARNRTLVHKLQLIRSMANYNLLKGTI